MQGNDPLMKGLARLMNLNNPDLILFVGEALVGNDGCDQLINFNRALRENSGKQHPRLIDGIVLTKFDTIDDKVGTAINMTYSTGQPIVFVGTGQRYRDLKRPNPRLFIDALFG
jgi:signal recognition particle receptor subunit alpha